MINESESKRIRLHAGAGGIADVPVPVGGTAHVHEQSPVIYVIRGPPSSGKSTIASGLCQNLREKGINVAYLEQDHFRGGIMGNYGTSADVYGPVLVAAARGAVASGSHVVVEGMLTLPKSLSIIEGLLDSKVCKLVYLSVDLEESLGRHQGREKSKTIPAEDIVKWTKLCAPTGKPGEVEIINTDKTETINKILSL